MVRVKATASDIYAKLARGECANFHNGCCQGKTPCTVVNGEPCEYFLQYVKPLLEYPEFAGKYSREAKISVALKPNSKVVRKRRQAGEPTLALNSTLPPKVTSSPTTMKPLANPVVTAPQAPASLVVGAKMAEKASAQSPIAAVPHTAPAKRAAVMEQPQLLLEITPVMTTKPRAKKRR